MKILVFGAGAIGGYVGARLALEGHAVTLVGRRPLADAVAVNGLHLIEPGSQSVVDNCGVVTSAAEAFDHTDRFDLALFTVKTYDTGPAIDALSPFADRIHRLWSLQNGVSSEELLGGAFGREKVIAGTILHPVSIPAPGAVMLEKRKGGIGIAGLQADTLAVQSLAEELRHAGFHVRVYADYRSMKWSKLLLNLIGNAVSAILDLNTLQVFADRRLFAIEAAALRETIRVASADGIRFSGLPGYPVPLLVIALRLLPLPVLQPVMMPLAANGRGSKMPSLHIDLSTGKRGSEIDELNGAVVRAGARLNIPTPANTLLVDTLKQLLSGRVARSDWRHRADRLWKEYEATLRRP